MQKLVSFPLGSHRLYSTVNPTPPSSEFAELIKSTTDPRWQLIFKILLINGNESYTTGVYGERLRWELSTMIHQQASYVPDLLLIMEDIARWHRDHELRANLGRGPSTSSLVLFLLGITKIDPVKHGLLFERYHKFDPEILFDSPAREQVIEYLKNKYSNFFQEIKIPLQWNLLPALSQVVQDFKYARREAFLALVAAMDQEFRRLGKPYTTETELFLGLEQLNPTLQLFFKAEPLRREQLLALLDQPKDYSTHAASFILSDTTSNIWKDIQAAGVVKITILGSRLYQEINRRFPGVDLWPTSPLGWSKTMERSSDQDYLFFYQKIWANPEPIRSYTDFTNLLARSRKLVYPLEESFRCPIAHPAVEEVLAETQGLLLFQEQAILLLQKINGLAPLPSGQIIRQLLTAELSPEEKAQIPGPSELLDYLTVVTPKLYCRAHAVSQAYLEYYRAN